MNKNYRVVWNHVLGTWVVASELAKSKTKSLKIKSVIASTAIMLLTMSTASSERIIQGSESASNGTSLQDIVIPHSGSLMLSGVGGRYENIKVEGGRLRVVSSNDGFSDATFKNLYLSGGRIDLSLADKDKSVIIDGFTIDRKSLISDLNLKSQIILNNLDMTAGSRMTNATLYIGHKDAGRSKIDGFIIREGDLNATNADLINGNGLKDSRIYLNNSTLKDSNIYSGIFSQSIVNNLTVNGSLDLSNGTIATDIDFKESESSYRSRIVIMDGALLDTLNAQDKKNDGLQILVAKEGATLKNAVLDFKDYKNTSTSTQFGNFVEINTGGILESSILKHTIEPLGDNEWTRVLIDGGTLKNVIVDTTAAINNKSIIKFEGHNNILSGQIWGDGTELAINKSSSLIFKQNITDFSKYDVSYLITGKGNIVQSGNNHVHLANAGNSYSGDTIINSGSLSGYFSTKGNIVLNDGKLVFDRDEDIVLSGNVTTDSGKIGGVFSKTGHGNLTLTGNNNFTGSWDIQKGQLSGAAGALTGNIETAKDTVINFTDSGSSEFLGNLSGQASLNKTGIGTSIIGENAALAHTGGTNIKEGTLQGDANALKGNINIDAGAKLVFDQTQEGVLNQNIKGQGTIGKIGTGTLNVNQVVNTANFEHTQGKLVINQNGGLNLTGNLAVDGNATLDVHGKTGGAASVTADTANLADNAVINLTTANNDSGVKYTLISTKNGITANINNIKLSHNGTKIDTAVTLDNFQIADIGLTADKKQLVFAGTQLVWNHSDVNQAHGTFKVVDTTTISDNLVARDITANKWNWNGKTLTKTGAGTLVLTGDNATDLVMDVKAGTLSGNTKSIKGNVALADNTTVILDGAGNYKGSITGTGSLIKSGKGQLELTGSNKIKEVLVQSGTLKSRGSNIDANIDLSTNTQLVFNSYVGDNKVQDSYRKNITGTGKVIKEGEANLTLTGVNSFSGGLEINNGRISADIQSLGSGDIVINNEGGLAISGAGEVNNSIKSTGLYGVNLLARSGVMTVTALGDLGTLSVQGEVHIKQESTVNVAGVVVVGNNATLGVDMRAKPAIKAGAIDFNKNSVLDISNIAYDETGKGINIIETESGVFGQYTAKIGGNLLGSTVDKNSFVIGDVKTEGKNIVARTSLVWDFSDTDKAHGDFNVKTNAKVASNLTDRTGIDASTNQWGWNGTSLTKTGVGTLELTGTNSYTGGTDVQAGTLKGNTQSLQGNIQVAQNANLVFNQGINGTYAGVLTGTGNLAKEGAADLTLTGKNSLVNVALNQGKLIGSTKNIGENANVVVNTGASLVFSEATDAKFSGVVTNKDAAKKGLFEKTGTGMLTLESGASIETDIELVKGTIKAAADAIKSDVVMKAGSTLELISGTFANNIKGDGKLAKTGTDHLVLAGAKDASVNVDLRAGSLEGNVSNLNGNISTATGTALTFNQKNDGQFNAVISGDAAIDKIGRGQLIFADNTTLDNLTVSAGAASIATGATLTVKKALTIESQAKVDINYGGSAAVIANNVDFKSGAVLNINRLDIDGAADQVVISTTNGINGNDYTIQLGGVDLQTDLTSTDTYSYGTVNQKGNDLVATMNLAWNHDSTAHGTFNVDPESESFTLNVDLADNLNNSGHGFGWNGKDLTKEGAGTLILNGQNTYTGETFANHGQLIIGDATHTNAFIKSDVIIADKALLGGHGSIYGKVVANNGSTVVPGSSVGKLSVGSAHFKSGSSLVIEADKNGIDQLVVNSSLNGDGQLTIDNGAKLTINALGSAWKPEKNYVIVTADGGITGTFTDVQKDSVFMKHDVIYNANDIVLNLDRNSVSFSSVGNTYNQRQIAYAVETLGANNNLYDRIVWMDEDQARASFDSLSGEIHASAKAALLNNAQFSRNAIYNHLNGQAASSTEAGRELWIDFWGQKGSLDGNANAAKLNNEGWGFLLGTDLYNDGQVRFGLALGYEQNDLKANQRGSKAESEGVHLMAYGQALLDQFELSGGLGYNWQKLDTKRDVSVGDLSARNNAKYDANMFQVFMKGQYNIDMTEAVTVSPYLALAYQYLDTDNFRENGNTHTNLISNSSTDSLVTTSLGVKTQYQLENKGELFVDLAWRHNSKDTFSSHLRFDSGLSTFNVKGASLSKNTGVINVGGRMNVAPAITLSIGYEGEFGSKTSNNSLKLQVRHEF